MDNGPLSLFLPPHQSMDEVYASCTHLGVGAHPDDLEVMAGHGILQGLESNKKHFFGVTCTTGGGSARSGSYKDLTDSEMVELRTQEQLASAKKGQYAGIQMLGFRSGEIYTHNPFDKHLTHVSVVGHLVECLRELQYSPKEFYGCEVWRGLDWLPDSEKIVLPINDAPLVGELIACHKSQTEGGKDYAAATLGRLASNATFFDARDVDRNTHQLFAVDLLPLLQNPGMSFVEFAKHKIDPFAKSVEVGLLPFSRGV